MNRRLVAPARDDRNEVTPHAVRERMQIAKLRHRLGATLEVRLAKASQPVASQKLGAGQAVAGILGAAGVVGLVLGAIQQQPILGGVAALAVVGSAAKLWLSQRNRAKSNEAPTLKNAVLVEPKDVARLDRELDAIALELPQDLVDELVSLKGAIARCVGLMSDSGGDNAFVGDDQLFVRESIRRYLPDSFASYLQVPQKDRAVMVIDDGKTALDLLGEQLRMLSMKLATHEQRLAQRAGDSLMRQQRFLAAKTR